MPECYIGLYRYCKVYEKYLKSIDEMVADEEEKKEKKQELVKKFLDMEAWLKLECSYCIKAHAELRRRRFSGRFGVGVTI